MEVSDTKDVGSALGRVVKIEAAKTLLVRDSECDELSTQSRTDWRSVVLWSCRPVQETMRVRRMVKGK